MTAQHISFGLGEILYFWSCQAVGSLSSGLQLPTRQNYIFRFNLPVMGKMVAAPGDINSLKITSLPVWPRLCSCSSLCKKCRTSAARFYAAVGEPLLGAVFCSQQSLIFGLGHHILA